LSRFLQKIAPNAVFLSQLARYFRTVLTYFDLAEVIYSAYLNDIGLKPLGRRNCISTTNL